MKKHSTLVFIIPLFCILSFYSCDSGESDSSPATLVKAEMLIESKQYDKALENLYELSLDYPEDEEIRKMRGFAYAGRSGASKEKFDNAVEYYSESEDRKIVDVIKFIGNISNGVKYDDLPAFLFYYREPIPFGMLIA